MGLTKITHKICVCHSLDHIPDPCVGYCKTLNKKSFFLESIRPDDRLFFLINSAKSTENRKTLIFFLIEKTLKIKDWSTVSATRNIYW